MKYNGAEIFVKSLIQLGVDTIFGYPGGSVLDIYDKLYDYQDKITHYETAHEQGATHAADGYARSTGKTGTVLATSGPGATNTVTGIATAYMDSVPLVVFTGNVPQNLIGKDSFQEIYITGITTPITKHNFVIRDIKDLQKTIFDAFRIANTGRKGPVLVDIPKDIMTALWEFDEGMTLGIKRDVSLDQEQIRKVAEMIHEAKRPVIYAGGGVIASGAHHELRGLMEKTGIPACNTIMAIGILDQEDELSLGMVGMHGKYSTNKAMECGDLIIAIGTRFSDRVALNPEEFSKDKKFIHIDIDVAEIDKNVKADESIIGDVKDILTELNLYVQEKEHREWLEEIHRWREKDPVPKAIPGGLTPHQIIRTINENTPKDRIYVTDVGQHQMWTAQYSICTAPRSFLTSGGLGTMGFGYGAGLGAKIANPNKAVIHITSEGSFHMNLNEISTGVYYGIPLVTVVMNNNTLGMVRQWQHFIYRDRFSQTDYHRKTDFPKLAEGFGARGFEVSNCEELAAALKEGLQSEVPTIINCPIDIDEEVLPMIPPGGTIDDIILEN